MLPFGMSVQGVKPRMLQSNFCRSVPSILKMVFVDCTYKVRKLFTIRTIYYRLKESIRFCKKPGPFNLGFCSFDLMPTERKLSALPFYVAL